MTSLFEASDLFFLQGFKNALYLGQPTVPAFPLVLDLSLWCGSTGRSWLLRCWEQLRLLSTALFISHHGVNDEEHIHVSFARWKAMSRTETYVRSGDLSAKRIYSPVLSRSRTVSYLWNRHYLLGTAVSTSILSTFGHQSKPWTQSISFSWLYCGWMM